MTESKEADGSIPDLATVAEELDLQSALLMTLCSRSLESRRSDAIIHDPWAVEIVDRLAIDCSYGKRDAKNTQVGNTSRAVMIDDVCKKFLNSASNPVVVTLGAGLCTRYYRLQPCNARWYDVDLPATAALRGAVLGTAVDRNIIGCSALDPEWMDSIDLGPGDTVLFIAEGLFMYFQPSEVQGLLVKIADRFPGSQIVFDALGRIFAAHTDWHPVISQTQAVFKWGIGNLREMEAWDSRIQVLNESYYTDLEPQRWGVSRILRYIPGLRSQMKIGHVRFRSP